MWLRGSEVLCLLTNVESLLRVRGMREVGRKRDSCGREVSPITGDLGRREHHA